MTIDETAELSVYTGGPEYGLLARLTAVLPDMPPAMAQLGQLILDDPRLPVTLSSAELAKIAGVSAPTVTRFCRQLGYSSYRSFRVGAAADAGRDSANAAATEDFGKRLQPGREPREILNDMVGNQKWAVQTCADLVRPEVCEDVARAILKADHVDLYGIDGSGVVANAFQSRLYNLGVNAHAHTEAHQGLTSAVLLEPGSLAFAVSNSGRTQETVQMLSAAQDSGAITVALTGDPRSPLASVADYCIQTPRPPGYLPPGDITTQIAQLFTSNYIYLLAASLKYDQALDRLYRIDQVAQTRRIQ